jgi:hypothetical protein
MGYDHYAAAKILADRLDAEGQSDWAEKLRKVMTEGATGTEIFMGLRWQLQQLKHCGVPLSDQTSRQVDDLSKELDRALQ